MALSNSYNYVTTRDDIIKRALRIIGALGTGETPDSAAVTEAAQALNDIYKEWQADGHLLWRRGATLLTAVVSDGDYTVGDGGNLDVESPYKLLDVYRRTGTGATVLDVPMIQYTRQEWDAIPNKAQTGTPIAWFFQPAAPSVAAETGTLYVWPIPDSNFVTTNTGKFNVTYTSTPADFDAASDNPDVPKYMINALVWSLADQLSYEYGVPIQDRAQITKKAQTHKAVAFSFDQEEGSLRFQPSPDWSN
jgi:hypothetical protein